MNDDRLALFRAGLAESAVIEAEQKAGKAEADARNPRFAMPGRPGYRPHRFGTRLIDREIQKAAHRLPLPDESRQH